MMRTIGNSADRVLQFREVRLSVSGSSSLALYEARLRDRVFVYLYLRPTTCALVWNGDRDARFNPALPFEFVDTQFTTMPHSKIEFLSRPVPLYGSAMQHKGYNILKCFVTLFLAGQDGACEYDLLSSTSPERYRTEIAENDDALARLTFSRFDSDIEHKNQLTGGPQCTSYSLTFERAEASTSAAEWEFSVSVPRDLELKTATLKWIARHHFVKEMREMDFEKSLAALSEVIKSLRAPVFS